VVSSSMSHMKMHTLHLPLEIRTIRLHSNSSLRSFIPAQATSPRSNLHT
jgi:hypothetical protein